MVLAIIAFTLLDAAAKGLIRDYSAPQVVWARFLGQVLIVLVILRARVPAMLRTAYPGLHFLRAVFQVTTAALFFASLNHVGLAEATALTDTSPVLVTLGAALFLGERLWPRRLIGIGVALTGALIPPMPRQTLDARLLGGSVLFGAGWALSGFCPGPALAALGWSGAGGLIFTLAMAAGMIAVRALPAVTPRPA